MKPVAFDYHAPATVAEALDTLAWLGYGGKILAGGQSLIPAMNFRMAQPAALVDLNNCSELFFIKPGTDGGLLIGAMTRDTRVEFDPLVKERAPAVVEAMPYIGHAQIRNRGTFGGNLAHADPAGQLPGVSVALEARMHVRSKKDERWVNADDFFVGPFQTVLEPDEMLYEVAIPPLKKGSGSCYQQVSRQKGAQAQVGVAARVTLDDRKRCSDARLVMLCVGEKPLLAREATKLLIGQEPSQKLFAEVAEVASTKDIDPGTDIHATVEYRRHAARVLVMRTLTEAFARVAR